MRIGIAIFDAIHLALGIICLANAANGCTDESFCNGLDEGLCLTFENVRGWCPKMCNVCPPSKQPNCVDDDTNCQNWKEYCEMSQWVQNNCKKTCDLCGGGAWSECTRTCGGGTRFREQSNNGRTEYVFEACGTRSCSNKVCNYGQIKRYRSTHACCTPDAESKCGKSDLTLRVMGGVDAVAKQWPWMVAVISSTEFCGGAIISKKYVLTTAHCFENDNGVRYRPKDVKIFTGLLRLSEARSGGSAVKELIRHPNYKYPYNDIGVAVLQKKLVYSSNIRPVCLPGGEKTPIDSTCYIAGWGKSDNWAQSTTNHLQQAAVKNLDRRVCLTAYRNEGGFSHLLPFLSQTKGYLCAGSLEKSVDSCLGDSGGPLMCQRCSSCVWYLAGIVQGGANQCGKVGVPGFYTEIREQEKWILQVTGKSHAAKSCAGGTGP